MNKTLNLLLAASMAVFTCGCNGGDSEKSSVSFLPEVKSELRAPAYPLITIDPYTCVWSFTDKLYDDVTRHWTGKKQPLLGALRVDGEVYRFLGVEDLPLKTIIPTAVSEKWDASYTEKKPSGKWEAINFDDVAWEKGKAAFGTSDMPYLSTPWNSKDIWVRRSFDLKDDMSGEEVILEYSHDDIFELYINGIQVVATDYSWKNNVLKELPDEVKATLKPGKNVIAAHCYNKTGGGYVDFGLFLKEKNVSSFEKTAVQKSVNALPTQTYYTFECGPVLLSVIFTSPLLMDDLDLMTRPVNYISYQVSSADGKSHDVQIYVEATPQWAVDRDDQAVRANIEKHNGLTYLSAGTESQNVLGRKGDDVRIDWGYFYLAAPEKENVAMSIGDYHEIKKAFMESGKITPSDGTVCSDAATPMVYSCDLGKIASSPKSDFLMIGYDDLYSIQYFGDNRRAYWKHDGQVDIFQAFDAAFKDYEKVMKRCDKLNVEIMSKTKESGGQKYADLCALAYRQSLAAHKLVTDKEGNLLFLSKENFSNGCIGTVDITYPSSPLYLIYNTDLLKGMMTPIFYFSESGKWDKPFAAHDVGTYPLANGQAYGGDGMPVEECGNMLILTTAIAMIDGNADYAKKHWKTLTIWADYLLEEGLDPADQLCTDDFAGHFAHNTNLSIKAIMGIAGYGKLASMLDDKDTAEKYISAAREMATKWISMADDGDHYRLTFDQPRTWSQKYNLIWDKLFGMNIFLSDVATKELAYYRTVQNKYGLPLDSRKDYTKSDWIMWSACLTGNMDDFESLVSPIYLYASETPSRIPLSDWHDTKNAGSVGFRARSVVGGYFMKVLEDKMVKK